MNTLERIIADRWGYRNCTLSCVLENNFPRFIGKHDDLTKDYSKNLLFELIDSYEGKKEYITLHYDYQDIYSKATVINVDKMDVGKCLKIIEVYIKDYLNHNINHVEFKSGILYLNLSDRMTIPQFANEKELLGALANTNPSTTPTEARKKEMLNAVEQLWKN